MSTRSANAGLNGEYERNQKYRTEGIGGIAECTGHSSSIVFGTRDNSDYQHL